MKKIILLGLIIAVGVSACEKEDDLPLGSTDERLSKVLSDYKAQLVGAEYGWKATLFPEGGAGYSFLFDFGANDRVSMSSDIHDSTAVAFESTYRLKAMQHPTLLFDTYSYLHLLADPDASKSGGDWGEGKYSDFEFRFDSATEDSIFLTGIYNGSKLVLTRASAEDVDNYITNISRNAEEFNRINDLTTYFKRLNIGNKEYDLSVDTERRIISFAHYAGGVVNVFSTTYYFTESGLKLLEPFTDGEISILELGAPQYNPGTGSMMVSVNNQRVPVQEASQPVIVDKSAAERFYNNPPNGYFWYTVDGFTIEGVEDAFHLKTIPEYYFTSLYIQPDPPFDGLISWTVDDRFFGPALRTQITNSGKIIFRHEGEFGTTPEEALTAISAMRDQLVIPEGYYVIQTGENSYDLVSAKDAKAWITFR